MMILALTAQVARFLILAATLLSPILPVMIGYTLTRRSLREQNRKQEEIHVLVNSRLTEALARIAHLQGRVDEFEAIDPIDADARSQLDHLSSHEPPP